MARCRKCSESCDAVERMRFLGFTSIPTSNLRVVQVDKLVVGVAPNGDIHTSGMEIIDRSYPEHMDWDMPIFHALFHLDRLCPIDKQRYLDTRQVGAARYNAVACLRAATKAAEDARSGVTQRHLLNMWDALDWVGQVDAEKAGVRPANAERKVCPCQRRV